MKEVVSTRTKPVLDEQTFARLLEAAYVLQEHHSELGLNLELRLSKLRNRNRTLSLRPSHRMPLHAAEAMPTTLRPWRRSVETQRFIQIASRLGEIAGVIRQASGTKLQNRRRCHRDCRGKPVRYRAGSGSSSLPTGTMSPWKRRCALLLSEGRLSAASDVILSFS